VLVAGAQVAEVSDENMRFVLERAKKHDGGATAAQVYGFAVAAHYRKLAGGVRRHTLTHHDQAATDVMRDCAAAVKSCKGQKQKLGAYALKKRSNKSE
jgi:hypothetical protein